MSLLADLPADCDLEGVLPALSRLSFLRDEKGE
jgi:hypothetical protein